LKRCSGALFNFSCDRQMDRPFDHKPFRVLVADDDHPSRDLLQYLLGKWGFETLLAADGLEAWAILRLEDSPAIAILDWVMPGLEGIELCRRIRSPGRQHYTYMLMLTAKNERGNVIEGLRAGADDYLIKPFDPEELHARLLVAERTLGFQNELIAAREQSAHEARHDYLTGILNRGGIMEVVERELSRSNRTKDPFSILLVDVDHFKEINDIYGHGAGDEVLRELARRIRHGLRAHDSIGRYGGDEFLIVLTGSDHNAAFGAAEKLRKETFDTPFTIEGIERKLTISLGLATSVEGISAQALIGLADSVLYRAKNAGRNCTQSLGQRSIA
jgi:two-component system, cell cycle response regulator